MARIDIWIGSQKSERSLQIFPHSWHLQSLHLITKRGNRLQRICTWEKFYRSSFYPSMSERFGSKCVTPHSSSWSVHELDKAYNEQGGFFYFPKSKSSTALVNQWGLQVILARLVLLVLNPIRKPCLIVTPEVCKTKPKLYIVNMGYYTDLAEV